MSNHYGPENVPPVELRCEAFVRGTGNERYFKWTRYDRQCSRRATSTRKGFAVCYTHANTDEVIKWGLHDQRHQAT